MWIALTCVGILLLAAAGMLFSQIAIELTWENRRVRLCVRWGWFGGLFWIRAGAEAAAQGKIAVRFGPFRKQISKERLWLRFPKRKRRKAKKRGTGKRIAAFFLRAVRVRRLRLQLALGVPDAAQCALLCGQIEAALRALGTQLPLERNAVWSLTVTPRFQQWKFALHLEGIILLRPVQSILANRKITRGGEEYVVSTSH